MAIPDYQTIMLPLLRFASDKKEHSLWQAIDSLANKFKLTEEEQRQILPSGQQTVFYNRIGWARTYMSKAGLLESTKRGYFCITNRGLDTLAKGLKKIDNNYLTQFEEFQEFRTITKRKTKSKKTIEEDKTPLEIIENAFDSLKSDLANDLLNMIKSSPPKLFENIVIDLFVKMGYGGNRKDAGQAIGKSGDEGIDGIIKEDKLGLDIIYVQAKRWEATIGRPDIQKFAGALQGKHAKKGIFVTTSGFSSDAYSYAHNIDSKIILIDGQALSQYMIDYNIGVSSDKLYEVKKIDTDYFEQI